MSTGTAMPEKSVTKRKRAIKELAQGHEFATQLQFLLHNPFENPGSVSAEELVEKILRSFTETLSVLSSSESVEMCQIPATTCVGSTCSGDQTSQDSGESRNGKAMMDRRGRYKRRKTSDSWMTISTTMEDGCAWRKYGQKEILSAKYPRCYFRCTHKYDKGCRAAKQVQKMDEDPNMNSIIYFGHHTCGYTLKAPLIISDSELPVESNYNKPSFEHSKILSSDEQDQNSPTTILPLVKKEFKDEDISALDSTLWQDLMPLESSENVVQSRASTSSSHGFDMETFDWICGF